MKKVSAVIIVIFLVIFSCGNREEVQVIQPEVITVTPPPPTLEEISRMPPSERLPENRIGGNIDDLIYFENGNRDSATITDNSYTIRGRVIPSATRLEVLREGESIYSQSFTGDQAPHNFSVTITRAENELAQGQNEYVFRLYQGEDDFIERTFVLNVLPPSPGDFK